MSAPANLGASHVIVVVVVAGPAEDLTAAALQLGRPRVLGAHRNRELGEDEEEEEEDEKKKKS